MTRRLELHLAPLRAGDEWVGFDVRYLIDIEPVPAGDVLLTLPDRMVSIPCAPYRTEDLDARDAVGPLTLREIERSADSSGSYRHWVADRTTQGPLRLVFRAPVRDVDASTPVGPLFDLRGEDLGLFGAGISFIPLPGRLAGLGVPSEEQFDITLTWHLDDGVEGVSSHGMGDSRWIGPAQSIAFCYYGAGTPLRAPRNRTDFAIHAYAETPFDLDAVATYVGALHGNMSEFFEDDGSTYHVLVRKNRGKGTGGTALPGSFSFGFSAIDASDDAELRALLAHEMAHAWPMLNAPHSELSWYTEGTAEYYSHVLPLRAGYLSPAAFAEQLTERFQRYDANRLRHLDNQAAADAYWLDPRAQRIPYGRGLRYLVATDGLVRLATNGEKSLDDLVRGVLRTQRAGGTVDVDEWIRRVTVFVPDAEARFASMAAGEPIAMPEIQFEGIVRSVEVEIPEYELGFDAASFRSEGRLVQGLDTDSNAARAGLRDGDALIEQSLPYHALRRADEEIALHIVRGGVEQEIRFVPAGRLVPTVSWEVQA